MTDKTLNSSYFMYLLLLAALVVVVVVALQLGRLEAVDLKPGISPTHAAETYQQRMEATERVMEAGDIETDLQ